jgi:nicotinamide riboside transporter PnuC
MTAGLIWSVGLAAIGILGIYLAGKKNKVGWAIGLLAQVLWIVFALITAQYGFILSALAYGFVYGKNFLAWRKEESKKA